MSPSQNCAPIRLTEWSFDALAITTPVVVLAAVARLAEGWWTDRRPTARLLPVCYAAAAGLCQALAVLPRLWAVTAPLIAVVAVCDCLASRALLARIGKAAPAEAVGAVMGVTGAVAAFGAVGLSLLLTGVLLAVAGYLRAYGLRVGMGLAVRSEAQPQPDRDDGRGRR